MTSGANPEFRASDTTTLTYWNNANKRFGVGTSSIRSKFEVLGAGSNTVGISTSIIGLQSTANAAHQWGMRLGATSGELNLDSNFGGVDVNIAKFERGGNIGLSTGSTILARLHVNAPGLMSTVADTDGGLRISASSVTTAYLTAGLSTNGYPLLQGGRTSDSTAQALLLNPFGANVVIGSDVAGSARLHVIQSSPGTGGNVVRIDGTGTTGEQTGLTFFTPYTAAPSLRGGRIYTVFDNTGYTDARLTIQSMAGGDTLVDTFSVKNSRVGILSTNPLYTLHIGAGNGSLTIPNGAGGTTSPTSMIIPTSGVSSYGLAVQDGTRNRRAGLFLNDTDGVWGLSFTFSSGGSAPFVLTNVSEMLRVTTTGNMGLGTGATVSARVHSLSTTEQLRLGYDASNYASFTVASTGLLTIAPTGNTDVVIGGTSDLIPAGHLSGGSLGIAGAYWKDVLAQRLQIYNNGTNTFNMDGAGSWTVGATRLTVASGGNVGIGTATPSAKLDVSSTTQGFLPPRMTTTQKNAISSPATGLVVYDTTLNKLCVYTGAGWETITSA